MNVLNTPFPFYNNKYERAKYLSGRPGLIWYCIFMNLIFLAFQTPEAAKYEEELEKIKLDLATISTTYLLTKNMRSKWKSQATEGEEVVEEKEEEEELEEEIREEEAEEPKEERNGEDEEHADIKEEDTVIDIE